MYYVETMRARRVLIRYGIALLVIVALVALSIFAGRADIRHVGGMTIPSSGIFAGCIFGAIIVGTFMIPGLNAEAATTPMIWTRPTRRDTIAWQYVAIDLVTIVLGFLFTLAACYLVLAILGLLKYAVYDSTTVLVTLLGLGAAVMWYGLVSAVAARLPGRGSMLAGLSWVVFLVVGGLIAAPFPTLLHALIVALNYLNPLAYFGGVNTANVDHLATRIPMSVEWRTAVTWLVGVAAIFASVRLWSTREA
ncbi:MAG: hypothetical protein JWN27_4216 [Candidatus Eremiobacteraeota bacterium]|nr:hypothetical protein [Candidatus Eremiobacteraeota bacterium]